MVWRVKGTRHWKISLNFVTHQHKHDQLHTHTSLSWPCLINKFLSKTTSGDSRQIRFTWRNHIFYCKYKIGRSFLDNHGKDQLAFSCRSWEHFLNYTQDTKSSETFQLHQNQLQVFTMYNNILFEQHMFIY